MKVSLEAIQLEADRVARIEEDNVRLLRERGKAREFIEWACDEAWRGFGLDGGDVQDKLEALGLIVSVPASDEVAAEWDCETMFVTKWNATSPDQEETK